MKKKAQSRVELKRRVWEVILLNNRVKKRNKTTIFTVKLALKALLQEAITLSIVKP